MTSLRHVNRAGALAELRRSSGDYATAADVADALGLSRPTAARLLSDLVDDGWAELELARTGSAGRPARLFRLSPRRALVASVDAGANNLLVILADLSGTVVHRSYAPHGHPSSAQAMAQLVARAVLDALDSQESPHGGLEVLALSVPAVVDRAGTLRPQHDSPAWAVPELLTALREELAQLPHLDLVTEGAASASLQAERRNGALARATDAVFVLAGDITAAAPLINGAPYRGSHGAAGAMGGLDGVDWRRATEDVLAATGAPHLDALVERAVAGEGAAVDSLATYASHLAPGIAMLVRAFDPDLLVLGGCLAPATELVLGPLSEALGRALDSPPPPLACAEIDHVDAPALGGLAVALDAVKWGAA